ncbi:hypothetical protein ACH5RR_009570 [Cinchona calisaya]|uniref:Uncharacterized protein n=1 Tax=Cinchona calisaya TaxID=153742 RepID=A0ABD3AFD2_9GENT
MEFIDSLIVNMADIRDRSFYIGQDPNHPIVDLKEKLVFFKNFIRFAELRGFETLQLQDLFSHLQVVAVNAARHCLEWTFHPKEKDINLRHEFKLKFSQLLQMIKPVDPQIHETYVQVLFCGSSHTLTLETDKHVLGNFADSLLYNIEEALVCGDNYMVSLKDRLPLLVEGLRFLRTILAKHLEEIDDIHEMVKIISGADFKNLIGAAINEAGIVICPLLVDELKAGLAEEMDFALCKLLENIKLIKVITSTLIFPTTDWLGFMDFLLENLKELPTSRVESIPFAKDNIQAVHEDLVSLRSFLGNILDQRNQDGKFQSLWSHVVEVILKTQKFVMLFLLDVDIPGCSPLEFNTITQEINLIKMEGLKIVDDHYSFEARNATKISNPWASQGSTSTSGINEIVLTLDDEESKIVEQLIRGSKELDIISIVGMPGLGKTTLAKSVYNNHSIRCHFHVRAWCVVSQVNKKKNLLLQILRKVDPDFSEEYSKKYEHELEDKLRKCLLKRKYLIVMDDVWNFDAWSSLERSLPNDANSSRILLTSRHATVAKEINPNREPHILRQLKDRESWDLLQKKLPWKEGYPVDLGRKIAKNCKGLPLTIVIVAGILANLEQDSWEKIVGRLSSSVLSVTDQCMYTLDLSYRILPDYLKSCFLYFGAFLEEQDIPFVKLMRLWIAEGFVQNSEDSSLEYVAIQYMNDLIGRNLVTVSKQRSIGGVKACCIHDLLHEFCVTKAKEEKFMSLLRGHDELFTFHGQRDLQRLSVHSTKEHFEKSRLFCPGVRSLLFYPITVDNFSCCRISFIFHLFKLLKVLDLGHINLGSTFPSDIAQLVELRYLAVQGGFYSIPPSVANLLDLETLVVGAYGILLPDTIWNMLKLRVLCLDVGIFLDSCLAEDRLEGSSGLHNLDTFSTLELSLGQSLEKIMRRLPNIRRLKCDFFKSGESNADCNGIVALDFLSRLESLHLRLPLITTYHIRFRFPRNLKKLTLSHFRSSVIPINGELPNLVVLKLSEIYFEGYVWDMDEQWEFPNLKVLELTTLRIVKWTGSDGDHFPCLQKLVLSDCRRLEEVPSCLEEISTLQVIEVNYCPQAVLNLLLKIKEQYYSGSEDLQVLPSNIVQDLYK